MIFKKGLLLIGIRVLLIITFTFGMVFTYQETDLKVTPYMFGGLVLLTAFELTWRLDRQERTWAQFLNSIAFEDFNRAYQYKTNSKELEAAYTLITKRLDEIKTDRAAEFRLLQTVLKHISTAVVCFDESGKVRFTNKAFNELLNLEGLMEIDHLKKDHPAFYQAFTEADPLPSAWIEYGDGQRLAIRLERFKLKGKALRLVSLTDIKSALELQELASYQKLLRVMTHEIMNSTTPILSLIRVVNHKLIQGEMLNELSLKDQKNAVKSLKAIEDRTDGMLTFVTAYKQINQPISPRLEFLSSQKLLSSIRELMPINPHTKLEVQDDYKGALYVDRALISQVLINVLKNAMEATKEITKPEVKLVARQTEKHIELIIEDNGPGIPEHQVDEIFVPFFTTKKEGSGIGLALSKNILLAHGATITYYRKQDKTLFVIQFS
jgi:two-component system nitrogen regulation sensor histidine kinase NtrY